MSVDDHLSNKSCNRPFRETPEANTSRRKVLKGGLAVATASFFGMGTVLADNKGFMKSEALFKRKKGELIGFKPVKAGDGNGPMPSISEDYKYQVLIPWVEPIRLMVQLLNGPPFQVIRNNKLGSVMMV